MIRIYKRLSLTLFVWLGVYIAVAQQEAALNQKQDSLHIDNEYIHSYYPQLAVRLYEITKINQIKFRNNKTGKSVVYEPNDMNSIGLGVNYRWISLGLSLPMMSRDEKIYGKTNNVDLQLNIYTRRFTIDGSLLYHKGFYMSSIHEIIPDWSQREFPYRSDFRNMSVSISGIYTVNYRKFSYRAAYLQNEWQKKSAGSLLVGAFAMMARMNADSSIVPQSLLKLRGIKGMDSTSYGAITNIGIAFGYGHTFVMKNYWYANVTLVPGLSLQMFNTKDIDDHAIIKSSTRLGMRTLARFAFEVNKERYFTGIQMVYDTHFLMNGKLTTLEYHSGHIRVFYGRRFSLK